MKASGEFVAHHVMPRLNVRIHGDVDAGLAETKRCAAREPNVEVCIRVTEHFRLMRTCQHHDFAMDAVFEAASEVGGGLQ